MSNSKVLPQSCRSLISAKSASSSVPTATPLSATLSCPLSTPLPLCRSIWLSATLSLAQTLYSLRFRRYDVKAPPSVCLIYIISTPNLRSRITASVRAREQGRFRREHQRESRRRYIHESISSAPGALKFRRAQLLPSCPDEPQSASSSWNRTLGRRHHAFRPTLGAFNFIDKLVNLETNSVYQ